MPVTDTLRFGIVFEGVNVVKEITVIAESAPVVPLTIIYALYELEDKSPEAII